MKKTTNPDRSKHEKAPRQPAHEFSYTAAGSASASPAKHTDAGLNCPATGNSDAGWNRYCDSRLKQFCMR